MRGKEYFSVEDLAERFGVDHKVVRRMLKNREFISERIGRVIRIPKKSVEEWENDRPQRKKKGGK